jgi:YHYH protein
MCTADANYTLARYEETLNGTMRTINTMGIPNHEYRVGRQQANPGFVCLQPSTMTVPSQPVLSGSFNSTPSGVIGILKTGAFVYNHLSNMLGVDDIAKANEGVSLDQCYGHHDQSCTYHYHEISKLAACTHDGVWSACELIGYLMDGFPIYSHCYNPAIGRYLTSCYSITNDIDNDQKDTSDYTHNMTGRCDLDKANGYDFTGKNITDSNGQVISGYAYVATDTYPYTMPYYAGSTWTMRQPLLSWISGTSPSAAPLAAPVAAPMAGPVSVPLTPLSAPISAPVAPMAAPVTAPVSVLLAPLSAPISAPVVPVAAPMTAPVSVPSALLSAPISSPVVPVASPMTAPVSIPTTLLSTPISGPKEAAPAVVMAPVAAPQMTAPVRAPFAPLSAPAASAPASGAAPTSKRPGFFARMFRRLFRVFG